METNYEIVGAADIDEVLLEVESGIEEVEVKRKRRKKSDDLSCLDIDCSFWENNKCTYGGLMYERPCYEDRE